MAHARDVINELAALHAEDAKRIARQPTGVKPGWNAGLNATVGEDGRLLYVGGSGLGLMAIMGDPDQTIASGDTDVVAYDDDWENTLGTMTLGANCHFTPPQDGWYAFTLVAEVSMGANPIAGEYVKFQLCSSLLGADAHAIGYWECYNDMSYAPVVQIFGRQIEYCTTSQAWNVQCKNITGASIALTNGSFNNRIMIEKVRVGA